jgi:hypothetical protein
VAGARPACLLAAQGAWWRGRRGWAGGRGRRCSAAACLGMPTRSGAPHGATHRHNPASRAGRRAARSGADVQQAGAGCAGRGALQGPVVRSHLGPTAPPIRQAFERSWGPAAAAPAGGAPRARTCSAGAAAALGLRRVFYWREGPMCCQPQFTVTSAQGFSVVFLLLWISLAFFRWWVAVDWRRSNGSASHCPALALHSPSPLYPRACGACGLHLGNTPACEEAWADVETQRRARRPRPAAGRMGPACTQNISAGAPGSVSFAVCQSGATMQPNTQ